MYSLEEYLDYYKKNNRFPDGQYNNPDKVLNARQLETKYAKYRKRLEKKEEKDTTSDYMQEVFDAEKYVKEVIDPDYRDIEKGLFWKNLSKEEKGLIIGRMAFFRDSNNEVIYDPMHIMGRGSNKNLASVYDNILYGPRYFHTCIDNFINPFSGKSMKREERDDLWIKLIGQEKWDKLQGMVNR